MPAFAHSNALLLFCSLLFIFPYSTNGVTSRAQLADTFDRILSSSSLANSASATGESSMQSMLEIGVDQQLSSAIEVNQEGSLAIEPTGHHGHSHRHSEVDPRSPKVIILAALACALVACAVAVVYQPQGLAVMTAILLYIFALTSMKLTVKLVYSSFNFKFAEFLTAGHLILSSAVGFSVLFCRKRLDKTKAVPIPTSRELLFRIVPIAGAFAFSLASRNNGLVYCTAAYAEVVGSTSPLVTVGVTLLLGLPFNRMLLLPTIVVVMGCGMSVGGEAEISILGTVLVFAANIGRAVKSTMQQDLLTGETREKFDPCALLAWTCLASATILVLWSIVFEGLAPLMHIVKSEHPCLLVLAIVGSCLNACMLNLMVLYVTKFLGAVGQVIAGQVASVLTVGGSVIIFGDNFTAQQAAGFLGVLLGAFWFSRISKKVNHGTSEPEKTPLKQKDADQSAEADKTAPKIEEPNCADKAFKCSDFQALILGGGAWYRTVKLRL